MKIYYRCNRADLRNCFIVSYERVGNREDPNAVGIYKPHSGDNLNRFFMYLKKPGAIVKNSDGNRIAIEKVIYENGEPSQYYGYRVKADGSRDRRTNKMVKVRIW